jgi:hypothetical protein
MIERVERVIIRHVIIIVGGRNRFKLYYIGHHLHRTMSMIPLGVRALLLSIQVHRICRARAVLATINASIYPGVSSMKPGLGQLKRSALWLARLI